MLTPWRLTRLEACAAHLEDVLGTEAQGVVNLRVAWIDFRCDADGRVVKQTTAYEKQPWPPPKWKVELAIQSLSHALREAIA